MKTFYVQNRQPRQIDKIASFKGHAEVIKFDYSSWADVNGDVTTVTVTVPNGDASISGESLTSNVKTFTVTTSTAGASLIKLTTDANQVNYLYVYTKDPSVSLADYGLVSV